jgi:RNA polymerase sigma-70 factor (ECF subfamily)
MGTPEANSSVIRSRSAASTSRSLLVRVRQNEEDAWNRLVTLYTPLVHYWCRKRALAEQEIPDVVQEVFQAVAANIGRFRSDRPGDTFRGWLRTITHSKILDYHRHDRREAHGIGGTVGQHRLQQVAAELESVEAEDDAEELKIRRRLLREVLETIQAEFRQNTWQAFWRVVVDGLSPKEAGEELEMQPGAVRVAKSRVLQRLREELGELMD